jgi:hypothetical protein
LSKHGKFRSCAASVVALALLIGLFPQDEYVHRMTKLRERLEDAFIGGGSYVGNTFGGSSAGSATAVSIDLRVLGPKSDADYEEWTKVSFKDGTWIRLKMPFLEFVDGYC